MEEDSSESSGGFFSSMTNGTDKPAEVDVELTLSAEEDETQRSKWDLVRRRLTPKLQSRPPPSRWDLLIAHLQAVDETEGRGGRNADLLFQETATDKAIQETKKPDMADAAQQIRGRGSSFAANARASSHISWEGTTHVANEDTKISSSRVGHSWMLLVCPGKGNRPRPNAGVFVLIMLWTALWLVADCTCNRSLQ